MNKKALLTMVSGFVALAQFSLADIHSNPAIVPNMTEQMRGNCDLMASNTLRAIFRGTRDLAVQTLHDPQPTTVHIAESEVVENLAHRRFVRYGDREMPSGMHFAVALDREMPGQPTDVVDKIIQMKPGDEAVMKIDHIYLFDGPEGKHLRPCTRMALRPTAQPDTPAPLPTAIAPLPGHPSSQSSISTGKVPQAGASGYIKSETIEVHTAFDSTTGKTVTRMFINGQEVDPKTRQPLQQAASSQPASASPQSPIPQPSTNEDTIVEQPERTTEEGF